MTCQTHEGHTHTHSSSCGHTAIRHEGHVDYLHDGHMHNIHGSHVDDHRLEESTRNPVQCTPQNSCNGHTHGPGCGHEAIPHGDHTDYLVRGHLHHPHGGHCDDHGAVEMA